jgi:hypothetical protein
MQAVEMVHLKFTQYVSADCNGGIVEVPRGRVIPLPRKQLCDAVQGRGEEEMALTEWPNTCGQR